MGNYSRGPRMPDQGLKCHLRVTQVSCCRGPRWHGCRAFPLLGLRVGGRPVRSHPSHLPASPHRLALLYKILSPARGPIWLPGGGGDTHRHQFSHVCLPLSPGAPTPVPRSSLGQLFPWQPPSARSTELEESCSPQIITGAHPVRTRSPGGLLHVTGSGSRGQETLRARRPPLCQ